MFDLHRLPSFTEAFTASVPLTRIRDIAHRNDIPHDLKQELKHTIQVSFALFGCLWFVHQRCLQGGKASKVQSQLIAFCAHKTIEMLMARLGYFSACWKLLRRILCIGKSALVDRCSRVSDPQ